MRIWCQSCGALGRDPLWSDYEASLNRHLSSVARPGTQVDLHGTDFTISGIDRYRSAAHFCQAQSIRNAIRAEKEGYDAFVMVSTIDAGFYEIRELVNIPVVMITESCLHLACQLAPKFGFFTHNQAMLQRLSGMATQYGMGDRMVPGAYLEGMSYNSFHDLFTNPSKHIDRLLKTAKEIVGRGANILFPAALPLNQFLVDNGVREIDGAAVMDQAGAVVKLAELFVDLKSIGIDRSRDGDFAVPPEEIRGFLRDLHSKA